MYVLHHLLIDNIEISMKVRALTSMASGMRLSMASDSTMTEMK